MLYARFVDDDFVGAGSDAGRRVILAAVRLDHKMIIADDERHVGVRLAQRDDDLVAVCLDGLEFLDEGQGSRFRILVGMTLECGDDIGGRQFLAVMEGHPLRIVNAQVFASFDAS